MNKNILAIVGLVLLILVGVWFWLDDNNLFLITGQDVSAPRPSLFETMPQVPTGETPITIITPKTGNFRLGEPLEIKWQYHPLVANQIKAGAHQMMQIDITEVGRITLVPRAKILTTTSYGWTIGQLSCYYSNCPVAPKLKPRQQYQVRICLGDTATLHNFCQSSEYFLITL